MRKNSILILLLIFCTHGLMAQINYFDLKDVELLDSPFKHAQELDKKYLLELKADRLLSPFLREAGLTPKAESYTNWENTGLDGHIGGHYVSALSLMYASTKDKQIKERLDYMISELKRCQVANGNGYIGGVPGGKEVWNEIASGKIDAGGFSLNGKWVPLYNIHKTYAGLRDAYIHADNEEAKNMLILMTDWAINLVSKLSEEQIQDMLRSEHGGLNETFADVAAITGDEKYLKLAHQFSHLLVLNPLLNKEDKLTGMHANTQIPKVLGYKRIADLEGNQSWNEAAKFFWETVVEHRSVSIGGNSVGEHFNPVNDFSRMISHIEGPETCNTYNMLRLSRMLYQTSLDKKYIDYYERALYNHILSTQHPEQGGFVYFTQMRPGHYRVYSQPHTSFWCCVGSGLENHAKYGEMIYAHAGNDLYVNLFIPSRLQWKEKNVEVVQENKFPDEARTNISINPKKSISFALKLRYPEWMREGRFKVLVNGKSISIGDVSDGYITIERKWRKGDVVTLDIPMEISVEQLPDKSNYFSILYGPIVLAAKIGNEDMVGLYADDSRGGHVAHGKQIAMKDMPIIVSEADQIASKVKPVEGTSLRFRLSGLFSEKYPSELELEPFFRLHESRYIIYWAQATAADVERLKAKIEEEEIEQIKLDAKTIDKVICGQQQPESDHFIKAERSWTGFVEDIHWREADGWFSYQMKNDSKKSKVLYLKYFDFDKSRNANVLINGIKVASLNLNGVSGQELQRVLIEIPASETAKELLEVKICAQEKSRTVKIVEVRLLDDK